MEEGNGTYPVLLLENPWMMEGNDFKVISHKSALTDDFTFTFSHHT